jgi:hypothetical protein
MSAEHPIPPTQLVSLSSTSVGVGPGGTVSPSFLRNQLHPQFTFQTSMLAYVPTLAPHLPPTVLQSPLLPGEFQSSITRVTSSSIHSSYPPRGLQTTEQPPPVSKRVILQRVCAKIKLPPLFCHSPQPFFGLLQTLFSRSTLFKSKWQMS